MAYDLVFWKARVASKWEPRRIYEAICQRGRLSQLEALDAQPMVLALQRAFPGCEVHDTGLLWQSPAPPLRGFQLHVHEQHVDAGCQLLTTDELNTIIDAGLLIQCPLYDPQVDRRFDGAPVRRTSRQAKRLERLCRPMDAEIDELGWVTCPGCSRRFKVSDGSSFADETHLKCSQRISLRPTPSGRHE